MPIPLKCACGKALNAPDALAGKRVKCPGCGGVLTVPAAGKPAAAPKPAAKPTGQTTLAAPPKPPPPPAAKPSAKAPAKAAAGDIHNYSSCPACNAFVSKKDAICVACGLNLMTGKRLTTTRSSEPTGPPHNTAVLCLVLNIVPLPGLGTLIGGRKSERSKGMIQMGIFLAGLAAVNPLWPDLPTLLNNDAAGLGLVATLGGILLCATSVVWSAFTGLAILNNAQPA